MTGQQVHSDCRLEARAELVAAVAGALAIITAWTNQGSQTEADGWRVMHGREGLRCSYQRYSVLQLRYDGIGLDAVEVAETVRSVLGLRASVHEDPAIIIVVCTCQEEP